MTEETIFSQSLDLSPADRDEYLEQACGGDPGLRHRVESLLQAHSRAVGFLEPLVAPPPDVKSADTENKATGETYVGPADEVNRTIGNYHLVETLGEGGMGTVYRALQTEPIKRAVALKVIRPGMASKGVAARFDGERQALARMDHPNIAMVHDGGTTANGQPYFVMELVTGPPVTTYCDEKSLSIAQRLALFSEICNAVQHAHQKGVIHRDLKPNNVLVAEVDGKPVPKVIDFGVAKAIHDPLTDQSMMTEIGMVVGTRDYMSPEMAELGMQDVDTRSDIYALGGLLYELLVGDTPFGRERFRKISILEALRVVRQEDPPPPSRRLAATDNAADLAKHRGTDANRLVQQIRGDLDWIVIKALDKNRDHRYESAAALAEDVRHHLANEPVLAGPPSRAYRARKFLRRHRGPLIAGATVMAALVAGIIGTSWGLVQANHAISQLSEEKTKTTEALNTAVAARNQTRQALDTMTDDVVEDMLARQTRLSDADKNYLKKVLALYEKALPANSEADDDRMARALGMFRVARIRHQLGETKLAENEYRSAMGAFQSLATEHPENPEFLSRLVTTQNNLGLVLARTDRVPEGDELIAAALSNAQALVARFPTEIKYQAQVAETRNNMAIQLFTGGNPQFASNEWATTCEEYEALVEAAPNEPMYRLKLGNAYMNRGMAISRWDPKQTDAAVAASEAGRDVLITLVRDYPTNTRYRTQLALCRSNLGGTYWRAKSKREAATEWHAAADVYRQLAAEFPAVASHRHELAGLLVNLGIHAQSQKDHAAARKLLLEAVPHHQAVLAINPKEPSFRRYYRNNREAMAEAALSLGEHGEIPRLVKEFLAHSNTQKMDAVEAATFFTQAMRVAGADTRLSESAKSALIEMYASQAIDCLRLASKNGFTDFEDARTSRKLAPLRDQPDFIIWLATQAK